ncbi:uncharacterized protein SCHCODRAFT_02620979 [Schizophyllum commune H4-8]|uniref:uncharacterized protein n=1 Tax=Schizophyllum commune (strain H4-8 / FGSC 9210) TaxID=578458 RepID=UPI0021606CC5|nr:uncharacterized protein SCHCODRAFT_02620979 [Schizophyllum commune H4-8]KAI5893144.1 hypothetical protein SCHCODRAFT_02620979 [Schizophyllum commune H4-8]
MPSRPGRARGLVAEWRARMAALLRFVRRRPERDGAAVVSAHCLHPLVPSPRCRLQLSASPLSVIPSISTLAWPPLHLTVVYGLPITSVLIASNTLYRALSL